MDTSNNRKRYLRNEFIKSSALLLLAFVLLISVVFAWFHKEETAKILPFYISIKYESDETELGQQIITEKSVVLPSATKLGDSEISVADFSKAIKMMPLEVESPKSNDVSITIDVPDGFHYYIDTDYVSGTDTELSYSQIINDNYNNAETSDNDTDKVLKYQSSDFNDEKNVYRHMVAIVMWADYDAVDIKSGKTFGEVIDENGILELNASMSFKVVTIDG